MDADIVMSPENDGGDVDCNVEGCYPCSSLLSRLGQSRNAHGRAEVNMTCWVRRDLKPTKRKAVTFLEWNDKYEYKYAKTLAWRTMWYLWSAF